MNEIVYMSWQYDTPIDFHTILNTVHIKLASVEI